MDFAIKIGDKFLIDIDCSDNAGGIKGHTTFTSADGVKIKLSNEPKYFSSITTKSRVQEVIELMRWKDISIESIKIIPKI